MAGTASTNDGVDDSEDDEDDTDSEGGEDSADGEDEDEDDDETQNGTDGGDNEDGPSAKAAEEEEATDPSEAIRALFDDIGDIINRLYRLAAKVRSVTTRIPPSARNLYRATYFEDGKEIALTKEEREMSKIQCEGFHERRIKEIIFQARRDQKGSPVMETDPPALEPRLEALVRRIACANAHRQQQFIFWREREVMRRTEADLVVSSHENTGAERRPHLKYAGHLAAHAPPTVMESELPPATFKLSTGNNYTGLDEGGSYVANSQPTATPTTYRPGTTRVGWPSFPKQLVGDKEFICPYCFVTCPPSYRGKAHWRKHLIQDLQPYTCTAYKCVQGDSRPLNTWEEWIVHEQLYHRTQYPCPQHADAIFDTVQEYTEHVSSFHTGQKNTLLTQDIINQQAQLSARPTDPCPFCLFTADNWNDMDNHLASHLESLALLALPQSTGLEEDEETDSLHNQQPDNAEIGLLDDDVAGSMDGLFPTDWEPLYRYLQDVVETKGLEGFFPPDDPYVKEVARKACSLEHNPHNPLHSPEQVRGLAELALYQLVIYCDDSGSMSDTGPFGNNEQRWRKQIEIATRLTNISTRAVPDSTRGVHLRLINQDLPGADNLDGDGVAWILGNTVPNTYHSTPIGTNLKRKILQPLIYSVLNSGRDLDRPYLVFVLTDGCPWMEPEDAFRNAIVDCAKFLEQIGYRKDTVRFALSTIGTHEDAEWFLDSFDTDRQALEVLHRTSAHIDQRYDYLRGNEQELESWLLSMLLAPLNLLNAP
ncbi:hypothetical protein BJY00DRAFT_283645 [Aspergillus carlsbadensis]|nr:hypothetical protein BJY00DRAFT_283645 [Aspergillus carlsbadensis]